MRPSTRSDVALYVWDYFYVSKAPAPGDEAAWAVIERATCRIRESEGHLDPPTPADLRVRSARRLRKDVRLAVRQIGRLSVKPEPWVLVGLAELEIVAEAVIQSASDAAQRVIVH